MNHFKEICGSDGANKPLPRRQNLVELPRSDITLKRQEISLRERVTEVLLTCNWRYSFDMHIGAGIISRQKAWPVTAKIVDEDGVGWLSGGVLLVFSDAILGSDCEECKSRCFPQKWSWYDGTFIDKNSPPPTHTVLKLLFVTSCRLMSMIARPHPPTPVFMPSAPLSFFSSLEHKRNDKQNERSRGSRKYGWAFVTITSSSAHHFIFVLMALAHLLST